MHITPETQIKHDTLDTAVRIQRCTGQAPISIIHLIAYWNSAISIFG